MMRLGLILLLAGLLAGCASGQRNQPVTDDPARVAADKPPEYTPDELVRIAKAYNDRGDSDKAVPLLERALAEDPKNARGYLQLGLALSRLEKLEAAITALVKAHELVPVHPQTAQMLGMAYDLHNQSPKAVEVYRVTLQHNPRHAELLHEYGLSLLMTGQVGEGLAALERARKEKSGDAGLAGDLGYAYLLAGKKAQAQVLLQEAVDRDPSKPDVVFNLVRACLANKDDRAAAEALKLLIQLVPDQADPHFHLGVVLHKLGERKAARAQVNKALQLKPGHAAAKKWLATHKKK